MLDNGEQSRGLVSTDLQTAHGRFTVSTLADDIGISADTCVALHLGDLTQPGVLVRIHSACLFSETFSSQDCDCADQLRESIAVIAREGRGVMIYEYQEGRGQGLSAKIRGMSLMAQHNLTTGAAYKALGIDTDIRKYTTSVSLLEALQVNSEIRLITRNPRKLQALEEAGYEVAEIVSLSYSMSPIVRAYVSSKQSELGHLQDAAAMSES